MYNIPNRIQQFIDEFKKEKIVRKNLYDYAWLSGSTTVVNPIAVHPKEIVCQWKSDKRIYSKFIKRMVEKYNDIIEFGYFWKSDGSCPSTITFKLK